MNARVRKVEVVVLGRGLAAASIADALVRQGRPTALLVERPGWDSGLRVGWQGWHETNANVAAAGAARLAAWQAEGLPGIERHEVGREWPLWTLDYDQLLLALGERIASGERSVVATDTRARGISVIEKAILGAIAEDSRYDARHVVNAAEDERYAAFARMMREPCSLRLDLFSPAPGESYGLTGTDGATWPGATPYQRDRAELVAGPISVEGAWQVRGVAGWPLLALGAAAILAEQIPPRSP